MTRKNLFPIIEPELWKLYKTAQQSMWSSDEIDFSRDAVHWRERLTVSERSFMGSVMSFFVSADCTVIDNLTAGFGEDEPASCLEAKAFYFVQTDMEFVHFETYSAAVEAVCGSDPDEKKTILAPSVALEKKLAWATKWITHSNPSERVAAFAVVEGLFFHGAFAAVFWLKKRGLMPGLSHANELISRDEALHCRFACTLLREHYSPDTDAVLSMIREAVECEKAFYSEAFGGVDLPCGMNLRSMEKFIEYVAESLKKNMLPDAPVLYEGASNPFEFMDAAAMQTKTNFFERRPGEYRRDFASCKDAFSGPL